MILRERKIEIRLSKPLLFFFFFFEKIEFIRHT